MTKALSLFTVFFILFAFAGHVQTNFKKDWQNDNPVGPGLSIPITEKIKIHQDYLRKADSTGDITRQFYGNLFLSDDHLGDQNFEESSRYMLVAQNMAKESGNKSWQGIVKLKSGWLTYTVHNDMKGAINEYEIGAKLSMEAKDSFCYGECLGYIAAMYSQLKEFELSKKYFKLAIPILKNYDKGSLASAYNNYSTMLGYQNLQAEAIKYLDSAIMFLREKKNLRLEMASLFNRGLALIELKQFDKAIASYKNCIAINTENKWLDNLANDYYGMSQAYEKKRNYKIAYDYLTKHYQLKDSIITQETKIKVARLTAKNEIQQKELALEKSQLQLFLANRSLEKRALVILLGALVMVFIFWLWWLQNKTARKDRLQSQENLSELTRILIDKNSQLTNLEIKVKELQSIPPIEAPPLSKEGKKESVFQDVKISHEQFANALKYDAGDFEINLYNQKILTAEDWSAFKIYFEKAFPGYLLRLRNKFPSITEAEERLFLFIKLNLTNKEAAAILGISADSVKKTRTRLRKRLALDEKKDIDEFVRVFY